MKIAVFGASVSAQKKNHQSGEITGYVEMLRQAHQAELNIEDIRQITYAGNRFSDGGMAQIHEVVRYAPDICLFEPLVEDGSRGVPTRLGEFRYAYRRLLTRGILPVTLLLPDPQKGSAAGNANYKPIRRICSELGLPEIEIVLGDADIAAGFKGVHTRRAGAELYAQQIATGLRSYLPPNLGKKQRLALVAQAFERTKNHPSHTYMCKIELPTDLPKKVNGLGFNLELTADKTQVRLVTKQQVGPFSPMLRVRATPLGQPKEQPREPISQDISVWDVFCHYPRDSFVVLANLNLPKGRYRLELETTGEDPAYATCRQPLTSPPPPDQRHMRPRGPIFAIADKASDLHITDYNTEYNAA